MALNKNYKQNHENLKKLVMLEVSAKFPNDVMVLPYDTGTARAMDNPKRVYSYGQNGVLDLIFVFRDATVIFADIKTGKSSFSKPQRAFNVRCHDLTKRNITWEIRSVLDALAQIETKLNLIAMGV